MNRILELKGLAKKTKIQRLFLRLKPVKILTNLRSGPKYATILSKAVDCTYSHTVKLLSQFEKNGLVTFTKKGRIKIVELTDQGQGLAQSIESVLRRLSKLKEKSEK